MEAGATEAPFPARLLEWAGNRSGGVRRLFDPGSGRPGAKVFRTNLLSRLKQWCAAIGASVPGTPRIVLLVGGPGNGKTEAIETTMGWLDAELRCQGKLLEALEVAFTPEGEKTPRRVAVDAGALASPPRALSLSVVQDASVTVGSGGRTAASLLLEELEAVIRPGSSEAYLCCVNRGVLDDALIEAIETQADDARRLLECISRAVSIAPNAPACWPLDQYPGIAVWPMDMESLLVGTEAGDPAPASEILHKALDPSKWAEPGTCPAGDRCPFCGSKALLAREREQAAFVQMLRWFELGSGKRWSFRDLFSLMSYLLAGHPDNASADGASPCTWAARQARLDEGATKGAKASKDASMAIFRLVAAQYQHALFHGWDKEAGAALLKDLGELALKENNTAMGLGWFLSSRSDQHLPAMIAGLLGGLDDILDPALASPESEVVASRSTTYVLRDLDTRFSRSVGEGLEHLRKSRILSGLEIDLLGRLADLDALLSKRAVRKKKPAIATRVQRLVRDFACRLARRSLGARTATVLDHEVLRDFQDVVDEGKGHGLYDVAREVERLLNNDQYFEVSLTTTFGQPIPPATRRATLVVQRRFVRPAAIAEAARPRTPLRFLEVGDGSSAQEIALTYDLFKAVRETDLGMSRASLPKSVIALLDTTAARLGGPIVRDGGALARAEVRLGAGGVAIEQRRDGFGLVQGGVRR